MRKVFKGVQRERLPLGERNVLWGFPEVPLSYRSSEIPLHYLYIHISDGGNRAEAVSAAMEQVRHGVPPSPRATMLRSGTKNKYDDS